MNFHVWLFDARISHLTTILSSRFIPLIQAVKIGDSLHPSPWQVPSWTEKSGHLICQLHPEQQPRIPNLNKIAQSHGQRLHAPNLRQFMSLSGNAYDTWVVTYLVVRHVYWVHYSRPKMEQYSRNNHRSCTSCSGWIDVQCSQLLQQRRNSKSI